MLQAIAILNRRTLFLDLKLMCWPVSPKIYCYLISFNKTYKIKQELVFVCIYI